MKRIFLWLMLAIAFTSFRSVQAQQTKTIPRIGFLSRASPSTNVARHNVFRQRLRELGYVEGKNIVIERRFAEGKLGLLRGLAAELVRLKVDIIVTAGPGPTHAAKAATSTIPIVMAQDSDPVADGLIASLSRPGGNITGVSSFAPELGGKRLEILTEIVPRLRSVAVLGNSSFSGNAPVVRELELTAKMFHLRLQYLDVRESKDVDTAFRTALTEQADAILTITGAILSLRRAQIIEFAARNGLPAIYHNSLFVEAGGLMSYSANLTDLFHRSADYVDRILKGAKPADLPVEQAKKFEFVINLETAKQIGVMIPTNVLARADRVIR